MRKLAIVLAILVIAAPVLASTDKVNPLERPTYDPPGNDPVWTMPRDVLFDNGPIENFPGVSMLQDLTLGSGTYGWGAQIANDNRMSDQFDIPAGETWNITSATFFCYQTGSTTTSTITDVYVQILDGPPDLPGTTVIWGDLATNRLGSSVWSGVYRQLEGNPGATNRPIMANTCDVVVTLGTGTYWFAFQFDGTLTSGPWAPPIVYDGVTTTGDAYQYTSTAMAYSPIFDAGDLGAKGMPFIVEGSMPTPVEEASWGSIKALYQ